MKVKRKYIISLGAFIAFIWVAGWAVFGLKFGEEPSLPAGEKSDPRSKIGHERQNKSKARAEQSEKSNSKTSPWYAKANADLKVVIASPEKSEEIIRGWNIPNYMEMSSFEKDELILLCSNLGQTNKVPAMIRWNFISGHVPSSMLDRVADDMIRMLPEDQLNEVLPAIDSMKPGESRTALYFLIMHRMCALGYEKSKLHEWIASREYEDEREYLKRFLPENRR